MNFMEALIEAKKTGRGARLISWKDKAHIIYWRIGDFGAWREQLSIGRNRGVFVQAARIPTPANLISKWEVVDIPNSGLGAASSAPPLGGGGPRSKAGRPDHKL